MFYWPFQGGTSFVDLLCFSSVLCLLCPVRVCLYVLRGHLLGKGWPLGSRLWCLLLVCHFPIGILGQVWYLIVSIPDLCNLTYFYIFYTLVLLAYWVQTECWITLKLVLGSVKIAALSISSHEQTQLNRVCYFLIVLVLSFSEGSIFQIIYIKSLHIYKFTQERKRAKIRNRYNQAPYLDTNVKVTTSQSDITNESQEVSPFPAVDHKTTTNRRAWKLNKIKQK